MKKEMVKKTIYSALLLAIITFFSYTLIYKVINIAAFALNIAKTGIFPIKLVDLVAYSALLIELLSILMLIFNEKRGIQLSLLMIVLFTLYITILYLNDRYETCGCGGILNGLHFFPHLLINLSIIIILIILLRKK